MTGIETSLIQTFGIYGVAVVLIVWGARAVWTWWTVTAYPRRAAMQDSSVAAQERIADAVEGMKLMQQTVSGMTERVFEHVSNIEMDIARLYQIKAQEQPSQQRRRKEPPRDAS